MLEKRPKKIFAHEEKFHLGKIMQEVWLKEKAEKEDIIRAITFLQSCTSYEQYPVFTIRSTGVGNGMMSPQKNVQWTFF